MAIPWLLDDLPTYGQGGSRQEQVKPELTATTLIRDAWVSHWAALSPVMSGVKNQT